MASTYQPDAEPLTIHELRQAVHQGLAPNWMVLFDALGGTQVAYEALLDDVAASVLETLNRGAEAAPQR